MNVLNHEKKAFRDMTPEERSAIVDAWLDGNIEALTTGNQWSNKIEHISHLYDASTYRTKPRQLVIPWEHIKPEYKWAAMDEDCRMFVFSAKPVIDKFDPIWTHADGCAAISALNIDTTGIDWRESLTARPEGV